jgi:hypothetical protein
MLEAVGTDSRLAQPIQQDAKAEPAAPIAAQAHAMARRMP